MNNHSVASRKVSRSLANDPLLSNWSRQPLQNCGWDNISDSELAPGREIDVLVPLWSDKSHLNPDFFERSQI